MILYVWICHIPNEEQSFSFFLSWHMSQLQTSQLQAWVASWQVAIWPENYGHKTKKKNKITEPPSRTWANTSQMSTRLPQVTSFLKQKNTSSSKICHPPPPFHSFPPPMPPPTPLHSLPPLPSRASTISPPTQVVNRLHSCDRSETGTLGLSKKLNYRYRQTGVEPAKW